MTPRKRWPNEAEWARQEAIALARRGAQELLNGNTLTALDALYKIIITLKESREMETPAAHQPALTRS